MHSLRDEAGVASAPRAGREHVALYGLEGEVLARSRRGDGRQLVLRTSIAGTPVVVKLYGGKRDWIRDRVRGLGHRWLLGKTGMGPRDRWRTERACLETWRAHGFDVPELLDLPLPRAIPPLHIQQEFIRGTPLHRILASARVALAEKQRLLGWLAQDWGRRHALALASGELRLVQAHAALGHVFHVPAGTAGPASPERLVTLDFEVAWSRPSALARLPSLEIAQLLDSLVRCAPFDQIDALMQTFVASYPDARRLSLVSEDARRGRLPLFAWLTRLGLLLRERGPRRKLAALRYFEAALAQRCVSR